MLFTWTAAANNMLLDHGHGRRALLAVHILQVHDQGSTGPVSHHLLLIVSKDHLPSISTIPTAGSLLSNAYFKQKSVARATQNSTCNWVWELLA